MGEGRREWGRGMKLSVARLWPRGVGQPWPFSGFRKLKPVCSESLCSFQTSICVPQPERGVDPHIAPQEGWV